MNNPSGQHAQGKWKAEIIGVTDLGGNGHDVYEIVTEDGYLRVCEYVSGKHAHLIAAAPELLAALKPVLDAANKTTWRIDNEKYQDGTRYGVFLPADVLKNIEAAISKAEGQ